MRLNALRHLVVAAKASPLVRDKIWNWYKADLSPHIKPDGRIILI
jgi:hypothetical protein